MNSLQKVSKKAISLKKENQEFVETLPSYILKLIDIKHQWRKLARSKLSTSDHKRKYNMITKIVQEIIAHKNKNFLSSVSKNPTSSRPFWQKINKIRNKTINSASSKKIKNLVYDGKEYQSESEQADLFGRLLQDTFSDSNDKKLHKEYKKKVESDNNNFFNERDPCDMPLFKLKDIKNEIKKLKKRSAAGPDNIHNLMLINASTEFLSLLLRLLNNSVQTSTIPSTWKIAKVTMIP